MGSTNHTSNYELSQFLGSDKPAWLLDYNGDMLKIDTQMKANADAASAAQSKADTADGKADDLRTDLTTLNNQVNDPTGLAADVATLAGTMNTVTSLIGNGEPTTTDKTLIGAINELNADINGAGGTEDKIGDLSNLETTDKTNLVAAINELDAGKADKSRTSVYVTGDGVKAISALITELIALIDVTKIKADTVLFVENTNGEIYYYMPVTLSSSKMVFSRSINEYPNSRIETNTINIGNNNGSSNKVVFASADNTITFTDETSSILTSGFKYGIIY